MRFAAIAADVVCVLVFAAVGRASHAEGVSPLGVLQTAWPFLAGLGIGVLLTSAWRRPHSRASESLGVGVGLWACTALGGVALRLLTGDTAQVPFVIVASTTLAVLLLGWRGAAALVRRSHRPGAA